ncbi:hypothetical protein DD630_17495 [Streptomyces sp. BSE7F]|nr:hypothetical protein DD630_17495 [Streptomyces sp. BSE7F]
MTVGHWESPQALPTSLQLESRNEQSAERRRATGRRRWAAQRPPQTGKGATGRIAANMSYAVSVDHMAPDGSNGD